MVLFESALQDSKSTVEHKPAGSSLAIVDLADLRVYTSLVLHLLGAQPFRETSPNVGLHQPTWGTSKSRWQSFGSTLSLLSDASKSLISEDGWLLDTDPRPPASWVLLHNNHWLGYNGAT